MNEYNDHKEFLSELSLFNILITTSYHDGSLWLELNGIRLATSDYNFFGYYCGGAYCPCGRTDQIVFTNVDTEKAIMESIRILNDHITNQKLNPYYNDIKEFLKYHRPKKSKIETEAIDRVLNILKDDYQSLIRFVKKQVDEFKK